MDYGLVILVIFAWPLGEVIQVDELVVDSTYGGQKAYAAIPKQKQKLAC